MSTRIDRAILAEKGINAFYSNWGEESSYVVITMAGFPLNRITKIEKTKRVSGTDHADARTLLIESDLMQNQYVINRKADQYMDFWGQERVRITKSLNFDPRLRAGSIIIFTSTRQNFDKQCFLITKPSHNLNSGGDSESSLTTTLNDLLLI
jgi:hypothetical protein